MLFKDIGATGQSVTWIIPDNPATRYRPKTWHTPRANGYAKKVKEQTLEDSQRPQTEYTDFLATEINRLNKEGY